MVELIPSRVCKLIPYIYIYFVLHGKNMAWQQLLALPCKYDQNLITRIYNLRTNASITTGSHGPSWW